MAEEKLLYRVNEAAHALGLSRVTLYGLMAKGEIGSVRIGASRRIPAQELRRYVERLRSVEDGAEKGEEVANVA